MPPQQADLSGVQHLVASAPEQRPQRCTPTCGPGGPSPASRNSPPCHDRPFPPGFLKPSAVPRWSTCRAGAWRWPGTRSAAAGNRSTASPRRSGMSPQAPSARPFDVGWGARRAASPARVGLATGRRTGRGSYAQPAGYRVVHNNGLPGKPTGDTRQQARHRADCVTEDRPPVNVVSPATGEAVAWGRGDGPTRHRGRSIGTRRR